ncbi:MAG: PhnA domain-containing protein [Chitinophagales bacterium]|nr:PhnA domain-containing protein [Bacteroidota bacterium]MCB9227018.1 PhnA domain-containing protein [Chitinophagales bacterium]
MSLEKELAERSGNSCELCKNTENLSAYIIPPSTESVLHNAINICDTCKTQIENKQFDETHWHCLNDSMWSEIPAVQVMSYRLLHQLHKQDLLDMMYMDDETRKWALSAMNESGEQHIDANGNVLQNGDKVVLTQTLNVKGSSVSATKGTVVHNIRLVQDNHEQIEGKIDGQTIVILTKYLRKN